MVKRINTTNCIESAKLYKVKVIWRPNVIIISLKTHRKNVNAHQPFTPMHNLTLKTSKPIKTVKIRSVVGWKCNWINAGTLKWTQNKLTLILVQQQEAGMERKDDMCRNIKCTHQKWWAAWCAFLHSCRSHTLNSTANGEVDKCLATHPECLSWCYELMFSHFAVQGSSGRGKW